MGRLTARVRRRRRVFGPEGQQSLAVDLWRRTGCRIQNIGIKGDEQFAPGWSFIFDLEAGFDPYSFQLSNGPYSVAQNAGVPLNSQNAASDSSRAGQFYNSVGYAGVSSPTYAHPDRFFAKTR